MEACRGISQSVLTTRLKWCRKSAPQDGLFDIRNNENPPEGASQANVKCTGAYAIDRN